MLISTGLWVAIPDSALSEQETKRDKSIMVSQIARACSIFRVTRIYIYHDKISKFTKVDSNLLKILLNFLNTPPYLRKSVYPIMDQLQFSGILHPIIAPHHKPIQELRTIKKGELRIGLIVQRGGKIFADVGLKDLIIYKGKARVNAILTLKFMATYPHQYVTEAAADAIGNHYWGYDVFESSDLTSLIKNHPNTVMLLTSRSGVKFTHIENRILERLRSLRSLLVVFGARRSGLPEILKSEGFNINTIEFVVNCFPMQGTKTVRLEEAILGTLAITNHIFSRP